MKKWIRHFCRLQPTPLAAVINVSGSRELLFVQQHASDAVNRLLDQVKSAEKQKYASLSTNLTEYGLDSPKTVVTLSGKAGKFELFVGETGPGKDPTMYVASSDAPKTPAAIIDKVYRDTKKALDSTELKARFYVQGLAPVGDTPDQMGRAMKEEIQLWARVVRERNIQVK